MYLLKYISKKHFRNKNVYTLRMAIATRLAKKYFKNNYNTIFSLVALVGNFLILLFHGNCRGKEEGKKEEEGRTKSSWQWVGTV